MFDIDHVKRQRNRTVLMAPLYISIFSVSVNSFITLSFQMQHPRETSLKYFRQHQPDNAAKNCQIYCQKCSGTITSNVKIDILLKFPQKSLLIERKFDVVNDDVEKKR